MKIENMGPVVKEEKPEGMGESKEKHLHVLFMTRFNMASEKHSVASLESAVTEMCQAFQDWDEEDLSSDFILWLEVVDIDTAVRVLNDMSTSIFGYSLAYASADYGETRYPVLGKEHELPLYPLFLRVCETITARDFFHASCDMPVVDLVHNFILLDNKDLLDKLLHALLDHARVHKQFSFLKRLVTADPIWSELSPGIVVGRVGLQSLAEVLDTGSLCTVVSRWIQMYRHQSPILNDDYSTSDMRCTILEVCHMLISRDFHNPVQIESKLMVEVMLDFYFLGDEGLFRSLVQAIVHQSRLHKQQCFLEKVLEADFLLNYLARVAWGRDTLRALCEERLKWYAAGSEVPEFNWRQPYAQLQEYPRVEAFLRGTQESFTLSGFSKLAEARKFSVKYFDGYYRHGYCAYGEVSGIGAKAHCVIHKSPVGFLHSWREGKEGTGHRGAVAGNWSSVEGPERKRPRVESPRKAEMDRAVVAASRDEGGRNTMQMIIKICNHHQGTRKPRGSWGPRSP